MNNGTNDVEPTSSLALDLIDHLEHNLHDPAQQLIQRTDALARILDAVTRLDVQVQRRYMAVSGSNLIAASIELLIHSRSLASTEPEAASAPAAQAARLVELLGSMPAQRDAVDSAQWHELHAAGQHAVGAGASGLLRVLAETRVPGRPVVAAPSALERLARDAARTAVERCLGAASLPTSEEREAGAGAGGPLTPQPQPGVAPRRPPAYERRAYVARTTASVEKALIERGYSVTRLSALEDELVGKDDRARDHIEYLKESVDAHRHRLEQVAMEPGAAPERSVAFRVDGRLTPAAILQHGLPASDSFRELDAMRPGPTVMASATVQASNTVLGDWGGEHTGVLYQYAFDLQGLDVAGWVDGDDARSGSEPNPDIDGMDELHVQIPDPARIYVLDVVHPGERLMLGELADSEHANRNYGIPLATYVAYQQYSRTPAYQAEAAAGRNPAQQWAGSERSAPAAAECPPPSAQDADQQTAAWIGSSPAPMTSRQPLGRALAAVRVEDSIRLPDHWDDMSDRLALPMLPHLPLWPAGTGLVVVHACSDVPHASDRVVRYGAPGQHALQEGAEVMRRLGRLQLATRGGQGEPLSIGTHGASALRQPMVSDACAVVLIRRQLDGQAPHYDLGQIDARGGYRIAQRMREDGDSLFHAVLTALPQVAGAAPTPRQAVAQLRDAVARRLAVDYPLPVPTEPDRSVTDPASRGRVTAPGRRPPAQALQRLRATATTLARTQQRIADATERADQAAGQRRQQRLAVQVQRRQDEQRELERYDQVRLQRQFEHDVAREQSRADHRAMVEQGDAAREQRYRLQRECDRQASSRPSVRQGATSTLRDVLPQVRDRGAARPTLVGVASPAGLQARPPQSAVASPNRYAQLQEAAGRLPATTPRALQGPGRSGSSRGGMSR